MDNDTTEGSVDIDRQQSLEPSKDRTIYWTSNGKFVEAARHSQTEDDTEVSNINKERCEYLAVKENNRFRMVWNLIVATILVYTGTVFPYRLCFKEFKMPEPSSSTPFWDGLELIVDILFWIDLLFNFFVTFKDKHGNEVCDIVRISFRYLRTFFLLNLLACLPPEAFTAFIGLFSDSSSSDAESGTTQAVNKSLRLIRLQRMSRLARLARLTRLVKMVTFVAESPVWAWVQSLRGVRVLNFFFGLVWAVHLLACGWYLTAALHDDHLRTWVSRRVVDGTDPDYVITLLNEGSFTQWAHSMYFVLTVFTTVGFGDMHAVTNGEIVYVCFTMITGAVVHSIIVSEMINTITNVDQSADFRIKQKELVELWANQVDLNANTTRALVRWTKISQENKQEYDRDEMRKMLTNGALPSNLLSKICTGVFSGRLLDNGFITCCYKFQNFVPMRLTLLLALAMTQKLCTRGEVVYYCYDHAWHLYLVMRGTFANIGKPHDTGGISELPPKLVHSSEVAERRIPKSKSSILLDVVGAHGHGHGHGHGQHGSPKRDHEDTNSHALEDTNGILVEEQSTLYPYQLFGPGNYFGEVEVLVEHRPRQSSVRCEGRKESGGMLLVLHKNEISNIAEEFPHIAWMWRSAARRRDQGRKAKLKMLTRGRSYRHFAAWTIQRNVRRLLRSRSHSKVGSMSAMTPRSKTCSLFDDCLNPAATTLVSMAESTADLAHRSKWGDTVVGVQNHEREKEGIGQLRKDMDSLRSEVADMRKLMLHLHQDMLQAMQRPMSL